jgi:hypothetical protein
MVPNNLIMSSSVGRFETAVANDMDDGENNHRQSDNGVAVGGSGPGMQH